MNKLFTMRMLAIAMAAELAVTVLPASAQSTLTWDITPGTVGAGDSAITGGVGTWNSINGNWTTDGGANNIAWDNTSPSLNTAVLDANGINGTRTVTLGETINVKALTFSNLKNATPVQKYTITGSTLGFASGGSITTGTSLDNVLNAEYAYIYSNITGAPNVSLSWSGGNNVLVFAPASGSQALGTVTGTGWAKLAGSTTGNTIVGLNASGSGKLKISSGTWTLTGTATGYEHIIEGGTLIISTGTLQNNNRSSNLIGGTLHYNNAAAIRDNNAGSGGDNDFRLRGGSLDNTRGSAITTSTWNPGMTWEANWTFIGSQGSNSDLYLGNGGVALLGATRQVTVQSADTTLAVGGVLSNGGLTKAGDGTLELRGASSYTGATAVNAGTLLIKSPGSLNAGSAVAVSGGTLGGNGTIGGTVTVAAAGSIAPSTPGTSSVGTLSIGGGLNVSAMANGGSGKLRFDLDAPSPGSYDTIAVTGTLTIGSGVLGLSDFVFTKSAGFGVGTYKLITSGGINPGDTLNLADSSAMIDGLTHTLQINGNDIELVVSLLSGTKFFVH